MIAGESRIIFPDRCGSLNCGYASDDTHYINDCQIEDVGKAWEVILIGVEWINMSACEERFNLGRHTIIIACVVGSEAA